MIEDGNFLLCLNLKDKSRS